MSDRRLKSRIQRNKKMARMKKQRAYLVCGLVFVCFFAVCGMLIERWCEEEQTDSRSDASHHQSLKRGAKKKAC